MSNIPISSLPLATSLDGSETVPIVQGGTTKRTTTNAIGTFPIGAFSLVTATASPGLPLSRLLAAQAGVTTVTDGGPLGNLTVGIATNGIGASQFRQSYQLSLVGNPTGAGLSNVQDIQATAANQIMRADSAGASIGWGALNLASANAVNGLLSPANGGTGVNNGSRTLTLAGALATIGAFASTFTMTGPTSVTFPTSGTLATTAGPSLPAVVLGDLLYGSGTNTLATLASPAVATRMLQSGASASPAWSTSTWPATTTANQLLYSSATNAVAGLATANSGVLVTSGSGVPSISTLLPTGLTVGTAAGTPSLLLNINQNLAANAPSVDAASQLFLKGYAGGNSAYAGIRFAMNDTTTGWGADIQAFDDTGLYGGALSFRTGTGSATGTPTERVRIASNGGVMVPPAVTGGSQGAGTLNATTLYQAGVAVASTATAINTTAPLTGGGSLATTRTLSITSSALSKTDDTNVTMTLGGSPTTALLAATSMTLGWVGQLGVGRGGTGLASGTSGGVLGYTATGTLASSVALTANALVLGGGAGATPTPLASLGTTTTVLHGNAAGAPTFGAVSLTADVSGVLPLANGGTNANLTASNGGIFYSTASAGAILAGNATARLPLLSGASTTPQWGAFTLPASVTSGGIPYFSSTTAESSSSLLTANAIMLGGGAGAAPATLGSLGTTTTVLHGNAGGAPAFSQIVASDVTTNTLTNATLAQAAAYTFKGNPTGSTANVQDFTIAGLTQKASPVAGDLIMIADSAASNATKYATVSSVASAGSVASIAGNTGAFTLSNGITNSTNDIRLASIATGKMLANTSGSTAVPTATDIPILHYIPNGANTTFTTPANSTTATVYFYRVIAGGGGGGGANGATSYGGGGGGGGYSEGTFTGIAASTGIALMVGAGGSAGSSAGGTGGTGGTSSIGAPVNVSCSGGVGGAGSTVANNVSGGVGGSATGGTIVLAGATGFPSSVGGAFGGSGAATPFGGGGVGGAANVSAIGTGGTNFGSGGGGGIGAGANGGAGAQGYIIIQWVL